MNGVPNPREAINVKLTVEFQRERSSTAGTFCPRSQHGRPVALTVQKEEVMLNNIGNNPTTSVCRIVRDVRLCKSIVHSALREQQLYPRNITSYLQICILLHTTKNTKNTL